MAQIFPLVDDQIHDPRPSQEIQMLWLRNHFSNAFARAMQLMGCEALAHPIGAAALASLSDRSGANLILFDLRELEEIEKFSFSIPGALLTTNVNLPRLVRWVPPTSTVAVFASESIPSHDARLRVRTQKITFYSLDGGLRSWCKAGLPVEPVSLSDRRWVR
jgi:rhodanese-related sulfurtransferase